MVVACAASIAFVLSAPFAGEVRGWLRATFPDHFVLVVGTTVAAAAGVAVGLALWRIREQRVVRYSLVALAGALAVAYSRWSSLGNSEIDVAEHVHFIEYGVVTWLFYRAWFPLGDASSLIAPLLAALTVGTCEEWFQWFIPARVGEFRDVLLNGAAIVSGLLFSTAVMPLKGLVWPRLRSWPHVLGTAAVSAAVLAGFLDCVHLGHEVRDPDGRTFRSIYAAAELEDLSEDCAARWAANPPATRPDRLSREDQYESEGLLHVQARNTAWDVDDITTAWHENRILEEYFAPVLDMSSDGHRWPQAARGEAERRVGVGQGAPVRFVSHAEGEFPILTWSRSPFRTVSAVLVDLLLVGAVLCWRRSRAGGR